MITIETTDLDVCQDCILFLANGRCDGCDSCVTATGDQDPAADCQTVGARMLAQWGHEVNHLVTGDEGDPWFSASPCDGCGSDLGGDRYRAHRITRGE